ncbi:MFS transporter [Nocardia fluminea]|uniref:MFS transporter n=1 Tax=Nocardia fluminea TaxID=134984 RepID=UPI00364E1C9B
MTQPTNRPAVATPRWALPIGILILFIDGYDLFVLGAVGPSLLSYADWHASPSTLGLLGSVTALGMPLGAFVAGRVSDTWGRRIPITVFLVWVSVCMAITGLAPNLTVFGVGRFLTGIALGALTPLVVAFVADWAPPARRSLHVGAALTGIALGGMMVAIVGRAVLPELHFQWLFLVGVLPLVLVPLCWKLIPAGLPTEDRTNQLEASMPETTPLREVFGPRLRSATLLFATAGFFGLVLVYGASTWLPTLMIRAGYDLHSALEFTIAFNGGAIIGTLAATVLADRGHIKAITVISFMCAAVAMLALSTHQARWLVLVMSAVAGMGALGTQNLINAYVSQHYPARLRGTALGVSLGLGRLGSIVGPSYLALVTALILTPGAGFYGFVIPAVLGAVAIVLVPARRRAQQRPQVPTADVLAVNNP